MLKDKVLIHHDDPDGFGCAYSFWNIYGSSMEYIPMNHLQRAEFNLSILKDREVYVADFAFNKSDTLEIIKIAKSFVMIDHHVSAKNELEEISDKFEYIYDPKKSGCTLCWEYLFGTIRKVPKLLLYIEDRDIYTYKLPNTEEILLYVDSYEFNFSDWMKIENQLEGSKSFKQVIVIGESIKKYRDSLMNRLISENVHFIAIKDYIVPAINVPFFKTEILNKLAEEEPFAAGYHYNGRVYCFSLRSSDNGVDVSKIAEMFEGGGGHKNASGFSIKNLKELE